MLPGYNKSTYILGVLHLLPQVFALVVLLVLVLVLVVSPVLPEGNHSNRKIELMDPTSCCFSVFLWSLLDRINTAAIH